MWTVHTLRLGLLLPAVCPCPKAWPSFHDILTRGRERFAWFNSYIPGFRAVAVIELIRSDTGGWAKMGRIIFVWRVIVKVTLVFRIREVEIFVCRMYWGSSAWNYIIGSINWKAHTQTHLTVTLKSEIYFKSIKKIFRGCFTRHCY
jgi:hypothetical protein